VVLDEVLGDVSESLVTTGALVLTLAAVDWAKLTAIAAAPRTLAAPTPTVTADIRASPCLRASSRAGPEVGDGFMSSSDPALGCPRR
jgi:hypothetical protein